MDKKKIILDTDPGVDDAMAIQLAMSAPELEIIGLTTVFGNVPIDLTTENALRLIDLGKRSDIPVVRGADGPLQGSFSGGVPFVHGDDGQGNLWAPRSSLQPHPGTAHDFMIEQILKFPHELTLLTLGPLTNLALALRKQPQIAALVKEVVIMGGNPFCPGNATPVAEANILCDPVAADEVLGAAWPMTMIGLDVTQQVLMRDAVLDEIAGIPGELNQHVAAAHRFYRNFFARANGIQGIFVHDSTALIGVIHPEYLQMQSFPIRVETAEVISRGKTWPALGDTDQESSEGWNAWRGRPHVQVGVGVDAESVIREIVRRLSAEVLS